MIFLIHQNHLLRSYKHARKLSYVFSFVQKLSAEGGALFKPYVIFVTLSGRVLFTLIQCHKREKSSFKKLKRNIINLLMNVSLSGVILLDRC